MKIKEKDDLLEYIDPTSPDLILLKSPDPEINTRNSADMGVGVAACVVDHFYKIRWETLAHVVSTKSRPDFTVFNCNNKSIVVEAKGSGYLHHHKTQKRKAAKQKRQLTGDINLSSCALFSCNSSAQVVLRDPPGIPIYDPEYSYLLQKADHYCRTMNLIGQKELSEYFDLMRKRILFNKNFKEYPIKENLYRKIKSDYVTLLKNGRTYRGAVKRISGESYIFCGVDDDLISLQDFKEFRNYGEDSFQQNDGNTFCSFRDGVCLYYIEDMERESSLQREIRNIDVPNYQDETEIADIKAMSSYSVATFFKYVIEKLGGSVVSESHQLRYHPDIVCDFGSGLVPCEIKKRFSADKFMQVVYQLADMSAIYNRKPVLIITDKIPHEFQRIAIEKRVILLDIDKVSKILKEHLLLKRYLMV
ncbi:MAG: hypothetical protein PHV36_10680 [Elusimicrobiales bacterium]|nr:hypothetical protein [Elusimicrobiales bacterium]